MQSASRSWEAVLGVLLAARPLHHEEALEPVRIVVELRQDEFQALSEASGRVVPADFLRLVALRLIA